MTFDTRAGAIKCARRTFSMFRGIDLRRSLLTDAFYYFSGDECVMVLDTFKITTGMTVVFVLSEEGVGWVYSGAIKHDD